MDRAELFNMFKLKCMQSQLRNSKNQKKKKKFQKHFRRCKAFNFVELVKTCLDGSSFYCNRALDVSFGRNMRLFFNENSRYKSRKEAKNKSELIKLSEDVYKVQSENKIL